MGNLSYLIYLNAFKDKNPSNNPSQNNFKWTRDVRSLPVEEPISNEFKLAPGETKTLFSGVRSLAQDNTTEYSIAPVAGSSNTYQLTWSGGTAPQFRIPRTSGADATTQVTVTVNGPVATFTSTGGTNFNLISGGVIVGDFVRIGNLFNILNQGQWQIIAVSATSFSVANPGAVVEGPYTLGSGFASQIDIYGAAGVQVNDTLEITGGFSLVTQGAYTISAVADGWVQFSSTAILPTEGPITTESIVIYSNAQRFVYLESDQHVTMVINNVSGSEINPLVDYCGQCVHTKPGVFLRTSVIYSMTVTNSSQTTASCFFAAAE